MTTRLSILLLTTLLLCHCGSETALSLDPSVATNALPVITRVAPTTGGVGTAITVFGYGFSTHPDNNIISIGGTTTAATAYGLVSPAVTGEVETLTTTIPAGSTVGVQPIFVIVFENTTNTDIIFTVTP